VLKDRELILIRADVVQQALDESGRDCSAGYCNGTFDRSPFLVACHLRDQIVTLVDLGCKSGKIRTLTNKIRTHSECDIDGKLVLGDRRQQELHVVLRFILRSFICGSLQVAKAEEFLKLVDENKYILLRI